MALMDWCIKLVRMWGVSLMSKRIFLVMIMFFLLSSIVHASLTDNLLSYWKFDSNGVDSLGVNNLTVSGATFTAGILNNSLTCVNTNDKAVLDSSASIPFNRTTSGLTLCGWYGSTDASTIYQRAVYLGTGENKILIQVRNEFSGKISSVITSAVLEQYSPSNVTKGTSDLNFICSVFNSTGDYTFVGNGVLINSSVESTRNKVSPSISAIQFCQNSLATSEQFKGRIDEYGIWNRTLNISEIQELYNNGTGKTYPFSDAPIPDVPLLSFQTPTPSNNAVQYYTQNSLLINVSRAYIQGGNTTVYFYNSTGSLLYSNISTSNNTYLNVSGLFVGVYFYNATGINSTFSLNTSTRKLTVYEITPGSIIVPSSLQSVNNTLNITWTNSVTTNESVAISSYQVNLLNSGGSLNMTLGSTTGNNLTWSTYPFNLTTGIYQIQVSTTDANGNNVNSSVQFNLTRNAVLNVTAYDSTTNASISSLAFNVTDLNTGLMEYYSTAGSYIDLNIIRTHQYSFYFDTPSYAVIEYNLTTNSSAYQTYNASLFKTNSVQIYVRDESSLALITNATTGLPTNITFISNLTSIKYNTTTGSLFVANLTPGFYEVKFNAPLYAERSYFITITNRSTQTLNAYLTQSALVVLFTYVDKETGALLENVGVTVYKIINGSWTSVATGFTDITGRWQVSVSTNTEYRFSSVVANYQDKTFNLNPVIFTSYTIQLTKIQSTGTQLDFTNINVYVSNTTFRNNGTNSFGWQISAPSGNLENYAYDLRTTCKNISNFAGVNSYGGINAVTFNLSCASVNDAVILRYNYTLTGGEIRSFTYSYSIVGVSDEQTFMSNNDEHYGMGLFERVLITVLITIIFAGLVTRFSNILAGLGAGLLIMSYLSYIGFVEWWIIAPTLLVGFILLTSWSTSRG